MHLQHLALVAWAASITAASEAYQAHRRLAVMPLPGLSLARRDTNGYKPETKDCSSGNTCEEACGAGFDQCVAKDDKAHCYNKAKGDKCCMDGSGNSCEAGYYCTSDPKAQNWCCPMDMDLAACASAYHVDGGLQMAGSPATSSAAEAPSSSAPSAEPTSSEAVPPKEASEAPVPKPTEMPSSSSVSLPATTDEAKDEGASDSLSTSSESASAATVPSSTIAGIESLPSVPVVPGNSTRGPQPPNITVSTAASTGISALLLVAAGMFALL